MVSVAFDWSLDTVVEQAFLAIESLLSSLAVVDELMIELAAELPLVAVAEVAIEVLL